MIEKLVVDISKYGESEQLPCFTGKHVVTVALEVSPDLLAVIGTLEVGSWEDTGIKKGEVLSICWLENDRLHAMVFPKKND